MTTYFVKIIFHDEPDLQFVDLSALDHEQAEAYAGDLRYQVEEAKTINAPVIVITNPDVPDLTLDPRRVVSIDLEAND